jgi:hypothetical protein
MKKYIFLFFVAYTSCVRAQSAFYQCQYLTTIDHSVLTKLLSSTGGTFFTLSETEKTSVAAYRDFLQTPFSKSVGQLDFNSFRAAIVKYNGYVAYLKEKTDENSMMGYATSAITGALSAIGVLSGGGLSIDAAQQTKIIDGLTKYYAEEFRKAQVISYMQAFNSTLEKIGELQVLFPESFEKLKKADPSSFHELGDELKDIFNKDLKNIPGNLIEHIDNHSSGAPLEGKLTILNSASVTAIKNHAEYMGFKMAADLASGLANNVHLLNVLNEIDLKHYEVSFIDNPSTISQKVALVFHGINLLQRNLLDSVAATNNQDAWVDVNDIQKLNTPQEWVYFAGLIYQQDRAFFNRYILDVSSQAANNALDVTQIKTIQKTIVAVLTSILKMQSNKDGITSGNDNYIAYMELIFGVINNSNILASTNVSQAQIKEYFTLTDYCLRLYDNARKKDYNNSLYYTIQILQHFLPGGSAGSKALGHLQRYGEFMADVVNAKNSEETKDVIRKHVAPPASFILKRQYHATLSITGQPGYFIGGEKFDGEKAEFKFVSGLTLPIGFELTFKLNHENATSGSIGFFAQLLDLGAVFNFRLGDSTSTLPDKIEFSQVFSPGGMITYGAKNSPITIGIGYQYTPQLRKVTTASGNEIFPNGHRAVLRLSWDIPFINIAKSNRKTKGA